MPVLWQQKYSAAFAVSGAGMECEVSGLRRKNAVCWVSGTSDSRVEQESKCMKAKTIDRLALTRQKFGAKMYGDKPDTQTEHREGYSKCPNCGQETLRHDGSCTLCENCGYSKCG